MKSYRFNSEVELARPVVAWLRDQGWEVYQEVQYKDNSPVADIVAKQGKILWVVEVKRSLTFDLIAQAEKWRGFAHLVSVAVPSVIRDGANDGRGMAQRVLAWLGIGLINVSRWEMSTERFSVNVVISAGLNRKITNWLAVGLREKQKTFAEAGNAVGLRWSPFAETCRQILGVVENNPGIGTKELIGKITFHYADENSARTNIVKWAQLGSIRGVRVEKENRRLRFYPDASVKGGFNRL